jgi:hypothetical protein
MGAKRQQLKRGGQEETEEFEISIKNPLAGSFAVAIKKNASRLGGTQDQITHLPNSSAYSVPPCFKGFAAIALLIRAEC